MKGSLKAFCSILGTLLGFSLLVLSLLASPALAQGKKKKKAAEDAPAAEAEAEGEAGGSLDSLMESAAEKKKDDKKKKGEEAEAEAAPAEEPEEEELQPDDWERPPMEEKAPAKEVAPPAEDPPVHGGKPISAALLLGWGFTTDRSDFGADPYGFMAGVRGGYTLDFALYLGVYFNYYLGFSKEGRTQQLGMPGESSSSYMQFGAEVGYDVELGPIMFRPSLGIGMAIGFTDASGETLSVSDLMLGPGITVLYPLDDAFFLGGDLRGNIVTGDGVSAVTLAATGGMKF